MNRTRAALLSLSLFAIGPPAHANDHRDGALLRLAPTDGDITAFYGWMSPDGKKVNLALAWAPDSGPTTRFSDAVQWVFRVASRPSTKAPDAAELVVMCTFDVAQNIRCWAGDEYVSGVASDKGGLRSASGRMRVFSGLRNDPFFFNLTGYAAAAARLGPAAATAQRDAAGCPSLDASTRTDIARLLRSGAAGAPPRDDFARQNVLALVIELDRTLATAGGPVLAVSASTHKRQ